MAQGSKIRQHGAEKTNYVLLSQDTMTQNTNVQPPFQFAPSTLGIIDATFRTAPSLTWVRGIQTTELDHVSGGFSDAALWEGRHSNPGAELASALARAMPQYSRKSTMKPHRARQASVAVGGRGGISSTMADGATVIKDRATLARFLPATPRPEENGKSRHQYDATPHEFVLLTR